LDARRIAAGVRARDEADEQARYDCRVLERVAQKALLFRDAARRPHDVEDKDERVQSRVEANKNKNTLVCKTSHVFMIQ